MKPDMVQPTPTAPPDPRPVPEVSDANIDGMVTDMLHGAQSVLSACFARAHLPLPDIIWQPTAEHLPTDGLRFLLRYWVGLRGALPMPRASQIDALDMKPALGNIMILDVLDGGADFRFRLYGATLAEAVGQDWTGQTISTMRRQLRGLGPAFYLAGYRAVLARPQPLYTCNQANRTFENRRWARLILPLAGEDGQGVKRFLVGNYALDLHMFPSPEEEQRIAALRQTRRTAPQ